MGGRSCTDIGCPARGSAQSEMCRRGHSHSAVVFDELLTYRVANAMAWDTWCDHSVIWPGAVLRIRSRWHREAGGLTTCWNARPGRAVELCEMLAVVNSSCA